MAYLIDGNNFIGHVSPYDLKDPRSKQSLVSKLLIFQKIKRTRIFLVFDGPPDPDIIDIRRQKKAFSVIYPSYEQNADMIIKEIISKQADLRRFFVVSSDSDIKTFTRLKGAKSIGCKDFNRQLKSALKKNKRLSELEKNVKTPTPLEVNQWIDIFKAKK